MQIDESFVVAAPVERVWAFITDPERVGPCIPGCRGIEVTGPGAYKAVVEVKVGPIKATFNLDIEVTDETPPTFAASTTRGEEGTRASLLVAHNTLALGAVDGGTEVCCTSDVSLTGRLGNFGLGVMKKKAKALAGEFGAALCERLAASEAA